MHLAVPRRTGGSRGLSGGRRRHSAAAARPPSIEAVAFDAGGGLAEGRSRAGSSHTTYRTVHSKRKSLGRRFRAKNTISVLQLVLRDTSDFTRCRKGSTECRNPEPLLKCCLLELSIQNIYGEHVNGSEVLKNVQDHR